MIKKCQLSMPMPTSADDCMVASYAARVVSCGALGGGTIGRWLVGGGRRTWSPSV